MINTLLNVINELKTTLNQYSQTKQPSELWSYTPTGIERYIKYMKRLKDRMK